MKEKRMERLSIEKSLKEKGHIWKEIEPLLP